MTCDKMIHDKTAHYKADNTVSDNDNFQDSDTAATSAQHASSVDAIPETPTIGLSQVLKLAGWVGTGGAAKVLIQSGDVLVNGVVETRRKRQLRHGDVVQWGEEEVVVELG